MHDVFVVVRLMSAMSRVCVGSSNVCLCVQTGQLALESLLTFSSKKAGDWFKEDMRVLGGLDHVVQTGEYY